MSWLHVTLYRFAVAAARQITRGDFSAEEIADECHHWTDLVLSDRNSSDQRVLCINPRNQATIVNIAAQGYRLRNISTAPLTRALPFEDATFHLTVCRYALASAPGVAVDPAEVIRVTKPLGRIGAVETAAGVPDLFGSAVRSVIYQDDTLSRVVFRRF